MGGCFSQQLIRFTLILSTIKTMTIPVPGGRLKGRMILVGPRTKGTWSN